MNLETLAGPQWAGRAIRDGQIYAPEWRRGVTPGEDPRTPLYASQAEGKRLAREILELKKQVTAVARLAASYRGQLSRESRLGLALSRILD